MTKFDFLLRRTDYKVMMLYLTFLFVVLFLMATSDAVHGDSSEVRRASKGGSFLRRSSG
jgi:hypothetical protein